MKKITFRILICLILFFIISVLYLSIVGVKTNKFNKQISNQIRKIDNNLDINLNELSIVLKPLTFEVNIKLFEADLLYKEKKIETENIKANISFNNISKRKFLFKNIKVTTKSIEIKNLVSIVRLFKNDPKILIAEKIIKNGHLTANIKIEFDESGKIKPNYSVNGIVEEGRFGFLRKYDFDKINFEFNMYDNILNINNFKFAFNNKSLIVPELTILKKDEFFISGILKNEKFQLNKDYINKALNNNLLGFEINKILFQSENDFKFKINNKFKINDLKVNSQIIIDDLEFKNKYEIKKILPNVKNYILLKKQKVNIEYSKNYIKINGLGDILIQKEPDKIEYQIIKKNNVINYDTVLIIKENILKLDFLNFQKDKNSNLELKIKAKKQKNKNLIFEKLSLKEKNNIIDIENLVLTDDLKIVELKKIDLDFIDRENKKNQIQIRKNNRDYFVKGKNFKINKYLNDLIKSDIKKDLKFFKKDFQINFDVSKIALDKTSFINDFNGYIRLKDNEINELKLISSFSKSENIKLTVKKNDDEKITTFFSDRAAPFIKRYDFIKGFNEGSLDFYSVKKGNETQSMLKIYDFKLKELPILTKILTLASLQGIADLLSGEGIRFNEFEMKFSNKKSLMKIDEIYALGPSISILMSGYIEKDKIVSLRGTLVPATTINKTISSIPVIGDILVGKKTGEGVFGVSFKVKGPPKKLETSVNPIKTLTPRFITRTLEKIKKN